MVLGLFWTVQPVLVAPVGQMDLSNLAAQLFQVPLEHQWALEDLCHHILPEKCLHIIYPIQHPMSIAFYERGCYLKPRSLL